MSSCGASATKDGNSEKKMGAARCKSLADLSNSNRKDTPLAILPLPEGNRVTRRRWSESQMHDQDRHAVPVGREFVWQTCVSPFLCHSKKTVSFSCQSTDEADPHTRVYCE